MRAVALVVLLAIGYTSATLRIGGCPPVTVVQDFDTARFVGTWYENRKFFSISQITGKCFKSVYSATNEDGVLSVTNSETNLLTKSASTSQGTAKVDSDKGEAKLTLSMPGGLFDTDVPYWVLGTDYDNYAVFWTCIDAPLNIASGRVAWIFTRDREPTEEVVAAATAVLIANGLGDSTLHITDQTDCTN